MNRTFAMHVVSAVGAALLLVCAAAAEDQGVEWRTLESAKVPLAKGLAAARPKGKPISGKYEIEDGKLQLSVYTASKGRFSEVIVDHASGKIAKSEPIKEGEDYAHSVEQSKAMAKAKRSLSAAVAKAVAENPGYRAVSVVPSLQQGRAVATVVLENQAGTKTSSQKLD
jgi:hypothetical protein